MSLRVSLLAVSICALTFNGCGGGGGGGPLDDLQSTGGTGSTPTGDVGAVSSSAADQPVATYATSGPDGAWSRVDLIPVFQGSPSIGLAPSAQQKTLFEKIQTLSGTDLDGDWAGPFPTLPTSGFDTYLTGIPPGTLAGYILGANNIYDLLQSTTGAPQTIDGVPGIPTELNADTFTGFTGGDIDGEFPNGDFKGEGGPGLFSNFPLTQLATEPPVGALQRAVPPKMATLPNQMGAAPGVSGRGPSPLDEHQFLQMDFSYPLDRDSVFNPQLFGNSFLGDTNTASGAGNINIVKHSVQHPPALVGFDAANAVDQLPVHVPGIAVIGGISAIPTGLPIGLPQFAYLDPTLNPAISKFDRVPTGVRALLMDPSVFSYIAYESPEAITTNSYPQTSPTAPAYIVDENGTDGFGTNAGLLILADPKVAGGAGGRVFGATFPELGSVNDFDTSGDDVAAGVGFVSVEFEWVRSGGSQIKSPYFHTFPLDQSQVGDDPRAIKGSYNRGAAITVTAAQLPSMDILDPTADSIGPYDSEPGNDTVNTISTRARFLVRFDREVVPNSVGFSRRHTLHTLPDQLGQGAVFAFNGNTVPVDKLPSQGCPLAPSIYLAINQPAGVNRSTGFVQPVASPYMTQGAPTEVNALNQFTADDGVTKVSVSANGLNPTNQNTLASLPRAIVPCDIYPLNQNNLQAYVVQPLIEMPPNMVVTLGVSMNGLGTTFYGMVNHGNQTRNGTMFTGTQSLDLTNGLPVDDSNKTQVIANHTIVKVNAGPMSLDGLLYYGGTNVALTRLCNQHPPVFNDDQTTGGYNVARSFRLGTDNTKLYINAPVSPQALYLAFTTGGAGVFDLSGNGYNTNFPKGGLLNLQNPNYLESSRSLPSLTQTTSTSGKNWQSGASQGGTVNLPAFGILGRYTSGIGGIGLNIESDFAVGKAILNGSNTPQPGINEGSSGYETMVRSGIVQGDPSTSTTILAPVNKVGIVTDIEVGDFLDAQDRFIDPSNLWTNGGHKTYNTPLQGTLTNNTIADPPTPNPPPLRFPVGLSHTAVNFDQADLVKPPTMIQGNEVFPADSQFAYQTGGGFVTGQPVPVNGLIFLNSAKNLLGNGTQSDLPQPPKPGFANPFFGISVVQNPLYIQTGPAPKTSTGAGAMLATVNNLSPGSANPSGLGTPYYQSRQQIGNFLFLADQTNNKLHAVNSNTMEIIQSLKLPDPRGLGLTADLRKLFVSNEGDSSVSMIDASPRSPTFMTEKKRTKVGTGPRAVACNPDGEDVFVLNYSANSISIINQASGNVRKTLISNGINRPYDMAVGMREYANVGAPAFASGCYHGFISNFGGNNVLVYESGPDGLAGIGFDNIIASVSSDTPASSGTVWRKMRSPRGITFDANAPPAEAIFTTIGAFVAHQDDQGRALVSRVIYAKDSAPGAQVFNTTFFNPFSGDKVFEVRAQYVSSFAGVAFDVALPDYNRFRFLNEDFGSYYNLLNAGATNKSFPVVDRNSKYPLATNILPAANNVSRVEPDRLYFSVGGSNAQNLIEVFDLNTGEHLKTITTPAQVGTITSYFSQ